MINVMFVVMMTIIKKMAAMTYLSIIIMLNKREFLYSIVTYLLLVTIYSKISTYPHLN